MHMNNDGQMMLEFDDKMSVEEPSSEIGNRKNCRGNCSEFGENGRHNPGINS